MRKFEYNALIGSIDALKEADVAFNKDYMNKPISEEQISLYQDLISKLDEEYIVANKIIGDAMYERDARKRRYQIKSRRE